MAYSLLLFSTIVVVGYYDFSPSFRTARFDRLVVVVVLVAQSLLPAAAAGAHNTHCISAWNSIQGAEHYTAAANNNYAAALELTGNRNQSHTVNNTGRGEEKTNGRAFLSRKL